MKWYAAALGVAFLLLQYRLWLSPDGISEPLRLKRAVAEQRAANEQQSERNRQLAAEVRDLKQGYPYTALEERARSDLGMVGANETFYQLREAAPVAASDAQAPAGTPGGGAPGGVAPGRATPGQPAPLPVAPLQATPVGGNSYTRAVPR